MRRGICDIEFPADMDKECIELCKLLNTLPTVITTESCCGHCKNRYMVFFYCDSIEVLSRLARAVDRNYSDGNWELLVDSCDTNPYGCFWLRSKDFFLDEEEMTNSVNRLMESINYWFSDEFDKHFSNKNRLMEPANYWFSD